MSRKPQEDNTQPADMATVAPEQNSLATLPPAKRASIVLKSESTEKQLRELVAKSAGIVNVVDNNGREEAHRAGMTLKNARVGIKNTGKAAREDAQAFSAAVIAEEKRLILITEAEEERIFKLRDDYDAEQARIKAEAEAKEAARVAGIRAKIANICARAVDAHRLSSDSLRALCVELAGMTIGTDEYAEFTEEAQRTLDETGAQLVAMYEETKAREEAEAERLRLAEMERQRLAKEAEAQRIEAARLAEEQARLQAQREAQAKAEAERAAQLDQDRQAMEAIKQIKELAGTTGDVRTLSSAIDQVKAIPNFAGPMGEMVQTSKDMALFGLEPRLTKAQAAEDEAAQVAVANRINQEIARAKLDVHFESEMPETPETQAEQLPLPESYSVQDELIDAGLAIEEPSDSDIIELVAERYGWAWEDTVDRLSKIDFAGACVAV